MRRLKRREFVDLALRISGGAGAALVLGSCSKSPTTPGGGGGSTDFLSGDARAAALDAVSNHFDTLPHTSIADDNQRLVSWLGSNSAFSAAGSDTPGTVWARFTDGTALSIVNDGSFSPSDFAASSRQVIPSVSPRQASVIIDEIPELAEVYLSINIGETAVRGSDQWPVADYGPTFAAMLGLQSSLDAVGYASSIYFGSIAEMRQLFQNGTGVLHMVARLGLIHLSDGSSTYALSTAQPAYFLGQNGKPQFDLTTYLALKDDLQASRVVCMQYALARGNASTYQSSLVPFYAITPAFISGQRPMVPAFPKRSFVFLNGCPGAASVGVKPDIGDAFAAAGASMFVSWDNPVDLDDTLATAGVLLPTMAGAVPTALAATPPRRAFSVSNTIPLLAAHTRNGLPYDQSRSYQNPYAPGKLTIRPLAGEDRVGILAPSIALLNTSGESLLIVGSFGGGDGSGGPPPNAVVMAGGVPISNGIMWDFDRLTVPAPAQFFPGGEVKVKINEVESNPVRLTAWQMVFDYDATFDSAGTSNESDTVSGTYTLHATIKVWIRADLHLGRASVTDDPPSGYPGASIGNGSYPTTLCTVEDYTIEGEITHVVHTMDGDKTVIESATPSGIGNVYAYDGSNSAVIANSATFSLLDRGLQRDPGMLNFFLQVVLPQYSLIISDPSVLFLPFATNNLNSGVTVTISTPFDASGAVEAGEVPVPGGGTLKWSAATPIAGSWPDPNAAA